jgi:phosphatidylinositol glycan class B
MLSGEAPAERTLAFAVFGVAALVGAYLRLRIALTDDGIYWPDEIYNSLEPAHKLAFGFGAIPWEYYQGARSWVLPALLSIPMRVPALIGAPGPSVYIPVVRILVTLLSVLSIFATYRLARSAGARSMGAAAAGAALSLLSLAIYFSPRALSENISVLPVVLGFALAIRPGASHTQRILGVSLVGFSVLLRLHNAIFAVGLVAVFLVRFQWRPFLESLGVLVFWAALLGVIDLFTWGDLFHSAITYLNFSMSGVPALIWGQSPPEYYFVYLLHSTWPAGVVIAGLALLGATRARSVALVTAFYLAVHIATPHKELRFMVPILPFLCVLAGVGIEVVRDLVSRPRWLAWIYVAPLALLLVASSLSVPTMRTMTLGDLGSYLTFPAKAQQPALDNSGSENRLLLAAYARPDLCGIKVQTTSIEDMGGYTYLDREVPLYDVSGPGPESGRYNYLVVGDGAPGEVVARDGPLVLVRISPGCSNPGPVRRGLERISS